jgi:hypothetical protein
VIFAGAFYVSVRLHPTGLMLWVLAAMPVAPILAVIVLMGRYLRDERDEYKRDLVIRCLLWGTAGCVGTNLFCGFLQIFGWKGGLPPFIGFWVFALFMYAAKLTYRVANRVPSDE